MSRLVEHLTKQIESSRRLLVVVPVATPPALEVQELPASERGEKGFGSSAH